MISMSSNRNSFVYLFSYVYLNIRKKNNISFLIDDDPDNTVSIMLDGIESRLHIINIDIDYVCKIYIVLNRF
jgi:hypothetical protein